MVPTLLFYQLGLVALVCVFLLLCWLWPNAAASPHQPIVPTKPSRLKRSTEPKPFAGLTQRQEHSVILTAQRKPFYNRAKRNHSPIAKDFR